MRTTIVRWQQSAGFFFWVGIYWVGMKTIHYKEQQEPLLNHHNIGIDFWIKPELSSICVCKSIKGYQEGGHRGTTFQGLGCPGVGGCGTGHNLIYFQVMFGLFLVSVRDGLRWAQKDSSGDSWWLLPALWYRMDYSPLLFQLSTRATAKKEGSRILRDSLQELESLKWKGWKKWSKVREGYSPWHSHLLQDIVLLVILFPSSWNPGPSFIPCRLPSDEQTHIDSLNVWSWQQKPSLWSSNEAVFSAR